MEEYLFWPISTMTHKVKLQSPFGSVAAMNKKKLLNLLKVSFSKTSPLEENLKYLELNPRAWKEGKSPFFGEKSIWTI